VKGAVLARYRLRKAEGRLRRLETRVRPETFRELSVRAQRHKCSPAEDWTGSGQFDVVADQKSAGDKPKPAHLVTVHNGEAPEPNLADRTRKVSPDE
jgi:hypothetical protein